MAVALAGMFLIACGEDDAEPDTEPDAAAEPRPGDPATDPAADEQAPDSKSEASPLYKEALQQCAIYGPRQIARQHDATSYDPKSAARAYAQGYKPAERERAFNGCLAGFGR